MRIERRDPTLKYPRAVREEKRRLVLDWLLEFQFSSVDLLAHRLGLTPQSSYKFFRALLDEQMKGDGMEARDFTEECRRGDGEAWSAGDHDEAHARLMDGCLAGHADSCAYTLLVQAEQESLSANGDLTPFLRYFEDACTRGVRGACQNVERIRKEMQGSDVPPRPTKQQEQPQATDI